MRLLHLFIFSVLIPGFVVGYIPFTIYRNHEIFDKGILNYFGLFLITLGIGLYLWSALSFLIKGKGTPSIWFAKHLKFLIGEEPIKMVSTGLYNVSRNPMYLGVLTIAIGQAVFFESKTILIYSGILAIFFHLVVVYIEEPHLKNKFGAEYEKYLNDIPRWIGQRNRSSA